VATRRHTGDQIGRRVAAHLYGALGDALFTVDTAGVRTDLYSGTTLDGLTVDGYGNLYFYNYLTGRLYRYAP